MSIPRVTVLMPVYNGERYLNEAVASILAQTYADFELLIINDGSRDGSWDLVQSFQDRRIVAIDNGKNLGLIATLNKGLTLACGDYVARMDCDDRSLPERLERQVTYLDLHPDVAVCGAWIKKFGSGKEKVCRYHTDSRLLECGLLFDSVLAHPAVMMRRKLFVGNDLYYDEEYQHAEDYELWVRASQRFQLGNVPALLLDYRLHSSQVSSTFNEQQLETAGRVRRSLLNSLGLEPSHSDFETHQRLSTYRVNGDRELFGRVDEWLCRLKEANDMVKVYCEPHFSMVLTERLVTLLKKMMEQGVLPKRLPLRPRLFKMTGMGWGYALKFFLQSWFGKIKNGNA